VDAAAVLGYLDKKYFQQQVFRAATFEGSHDNR